MSDFRVLDFRKNKLIKMDKKDKIGFFFSKKINKISSMF